MTPAFDPQAAFAQLMTRLDSIDSTQRDMKEVLIQTVDIQTSMLTRQAQMQQTQAQMQQTQERMQQTQARMQADISQLQGSQLNLLRIQKDMLDYMKFTFDQQAKWNERQDQFNIIFLDEIRDIKRDVREVKSDVSELKDDVREIKPKVMGEMETRLIRLENFMNDQLRKAS